LAALAAIMLGASIYLWTIVAEPGTQMLAAMGAGAADWFTVVLILAAVRADLRERAKSVTR
jgi:hypothetical protein